VNLMLPNYDAWALRGPEEQHEVGTEWRDICNRYPEPDEDQPRGYRTKPCTGTMYNNEGDIICDTCGEADQ
jgi:hypothetical protein